MRCATVPLDVTMIAVPVSKSLQEVTAAQGTGHFFYYITTRLLPMTRLNRKVSISSRRQFWWCMTWGWRRSESTPAPSVPPAVQGRGHPIIIAVDGNWIYIYVDIRVNVCTVGWRCSVQRGVRSGQEAVDTRSPGHCLGHMGVVRYDVLQFCCTFSIPTDLQIIRRISKSRYSQLIQQWWWG